MTITATVIADSITPKPTFADVKPKRITTLQLRYPRFIHAEFMTHRMFSRNASSSRAIPVKRLIEDIKRDTAMPIHWGKNQPGMQAREEHFESVQTVDDVTGDVFLMDREEAWYSARDAAIHIAEAYDRSGYHKQIVNRLLEPFSHINVVVTATEWDNFFELRFHPDAQPEIFQLAKAMKEAIKESVPAVVDWHLPYVVEGEREFWGLDIALKCSVARCARVSYKTHEDKEPVIENDIKLFNQLVGARPFHASPTEHQAQVGPSPESKSRNFRGWKQYREILGV